MLWGKPNHSRVLQIPTAHVTRAPSSTAALAAAASRTANIPPSRCRGISGSISSATCILAISPGTGLGQSKAPVREQFGVLPERTDRSGRAGPALLQGRVLCGVCVNVWVFITWRKRTRWKSTYVCQEEAIRWVAKVCQRVPGKVVDRAIRRSFAGVGPTCDNGGRPRRAAGNGSAFAETDLRRRQQVERARDQAELARRRYMSVHR